MSIGLLELLIIVVLVLFLFAAPVLTFFLGYVLGKKRSDVSESSGADAPPIPSAPEEPRDE